MAKVLIVDINRCNGCHNCQIACKDEHCDQPWLPYAEAQPPTGQFWMKVVEKVRGQVPWTRISYIPTLCNHCADAPCMAFAKNKAGESSEVIYRRDDGLVIIDPVKSKEPGIGRELADACPIGAIYYNADKDIAQKCTGCAHLLDNGWDVPRCVDACMTDALLWVDEDEATAKQAAGLLEQLPALKGLGARVYYKGLPKRFIAGKLVDFEADEVVIGTEVSLLLAGDSSDNSADDAAVDTADRPAGDAADDTAGSSAGDAGKDEIAVATTKTDEFGDFMFDQVEPKAYIVCVGDKKISADVSEIDLSLGDIGIA